MRYLRKKDIGLAVFIVLLMLVTASGNGFFGLRRTECIYIIGFMAVYNGIKIYRTRTELKYLLPLTYLLFTVWTNRNPSDTWPYVLIYASGTLVIFSKLVDDKALNALMKAYKLIGLLNAIAILLSPIMPSVVSTVAGFLNYPPSPAASIAKTLSSINRGIYYGFCGEKSLAAFIIVVALNIYICEFFYWGGLSREKKVKVAILMVALMMTGKRMEFLIPIICFLLFFLIIRRHGKGIKIVGILLIGAVAVYIIPLVVPQAALVLSRFKDSGADSFNTGRDVLWACALNMYKNSPLIGTGYGTFNSIFSGSSSLEFTGNAVWGYHAHSIYYQILGECGIIGCICWGLAFGWCFVKGMWSIFNATETISMELLYSVSMLLLILVYGLSGNPLYYKDQLFFSFFALAYFRRFELLQERILKI